MSGHPWRGSLIDVLAIAAAIVVVAARRSPRRPPKAEEECGPEKLSDGLRSRARVGTFAWMMVAGVVLILLAAAACGGQPTEAPPAPIGDTGISAPSPTAGSPGPSPAIGPRYPNLKRLDEPFDRFAYKSAYSDCRLIGVDGTAEAFGGEPGDPPSVASAYAMAVFPDAVEHQDATFRGCLDGFKAASP